MIEFAIEPADADPPFRRVGKADKMPQGGLAQPPHPRPQYRPGASVMSMSSRHP
jgi:hypothetical protein